MAKPREFDNDQLDYLLRVAEGRSNFAEDWALRKGLIGWEHNYAKDKPRLILTRKGEDVLTSNNWHVEGRLVIKSYPKAEGEGGGPLPESMRDK